MASPTNADIEKRLVDLESRFREYLEFFNAAPPFGSRQLQNHRRTLNSLSSFASASDAARDGEFANSLAETPKSWDIGVERSKTDLVQPWEFREQLRRISLAVAQLERQRIDELTIDNESGVARLIWRIIRELDIVTKDGRPVKRKVVSGTKTIHHLLPDLVFPIDNEYTGTFFGCDDFGHHAEQRFTFVFCRVAASARAVAPKVMSGRGGTLAGQKSLTTPLLAIAASMT
jgi:hypothetical protein